MTQNEIKEKCRYFKESIYSLNQQWKEIQLLCKHPNCYYTFWASDLICKDCGLVR
jgi:hypothetical protein